MGPTTLFSVIELLNSGATSAISQALELVERGGTVLFFAPTEPGVSVPISVKDLFWRNEITLTSSHGGSPGDYAAALELIQAGKIRVREMISHRLGLEEAGHFCLSLRGVAGDVTISLARFQSLITDYCLLSTDYWFPKSDYRAAEVATGCFLNRQGQRITFWLFVTQRG